MACQNNGECLQALCDEALACQQIVAAEETEFAAVSAATVNGKKVSQGNHSPTFCIALSLTYVLVSLGT